MYNSYTTCLLYETFYSKILSVCGYMQYTCYSSSIVSPQLVIGEDGGCCSILEHSAGDGPPSIASNIFTMDLLVTSVLINYMYIHVCIYMYYVWKPGFVCTYTVWMLFITLNRFYWSTCF